MRCLSQKSFSQSLFHPSLKTTATKTKPECATNHKEKVLLMIVAVAANVPPQHAAVFGDLRFDRAQPAPIKRHQKPLSELISKCQTTF
jgi:hypothetical protein